MRSALLPTAARTSLKQSKSQVSPTFASKSWVRKANTSLKLESSWPPSRISWTALRSTPKSSGFTCWRWANARVKEHSPCSIPKRLWRPELYAFSTTALEPATGTDAGLLAGEKALGALSEEAGVPLLDPHGIAVDPTTHDVLILGQQDESKKKGEEEPRAAVQRVHTEGAAEGELGPRYVDTENCLDEGEAIEAEPACAEGSGQPTSPFVSPGGRVYGMRAGELWEIPASEGAAEAFASRAKAYEDEAHAALCDRPGPGYREGKKASSNPSSKANRGVRWRSCPPAPRRAGSISTRKSPPKKEAAPSARTRARPCSATTKTVERRARGSSAGRLDRTGPAKTKSASCRWGTGSSCWAPTGPGGCCCST